MDPERYQQDQVATDRRLIFSRKGWDSGYGGAPSPVLPDGRMVSLPIPEEGGTLRYSDFRIDDDHTYLDLLMRLNITRIRAPRGADKNRWLEVASNPGVHLDPDLRLDATPRLTGWRPLFGQVAQSQTHLDNQGVRSGDLFLFFGRFAPTVLTSDGKLKFGRRSEWVQAIWGWMEIGAVRRACEALAEWPWARRHPHLLERNLKRLPANNTVYAAAHESTWLPGKPGAGVFDWNECRRLTKTGATPGVWNLPRCLAPDRTERPLTGQYKDGWIIEDDKVTLRSARIGQEFVVDATPEIEAWVAEISGS